MPCTKIFISSVNEDGLKALRKKAFDELKELGHDPQMWEINLGPWLAHIDPVKKCLESVQSSDIYLLFLGHKAGTFQKDVQRTVTHLEFLKAYNEQKTILVFAESQVKECFFRVAKVLIGQYIEQFVEDHGVSPSPIEITDYLKTQRGLLEGVEPYVWFFMYDLINRGVYIEDISIGVDINWKEYFSDLLRRGSMLLPLAESIEANNKQLIQYDEVLNTIRDCIPHLEIGFRDHETFLKFLVNKSLGGKIEYSYNHYLSETVGEFHDCIAATLYIHEYDQMKFVAKYGEADGDAVYLVSDPNSYVALTYRQQPRVDQVFFKESKGMLYYCITAGRHVLTLHFPLNWDNMKYIFYKESVNDSIIRKSALTVSFIKLLLGGM
ncbi:DUF4062 domain-containing protein [Alicyclobacillus acidoterrestris]|uniref:DUF4062 domain-containing protein n=1 Tax=Alicyclobacillus acidoterrestris TaxID=1450 RepID=UPI003F52A246